MSSAAEEALTLGLRSRVRSRTRHYWKWRYMFLLLAPRVVALVLFSNIPMYGIIIAFQDHRPGKGFLGCEWVGLQNFINIFRVSATGSLRAVKNIVTLS